MYGDGLGGIRDASESESASLGAHSGWHKVRTQAVVVRKEPEEPQWGYHVGFY
jgi:hypothetical protein